MNKYCTDAFIDSQSIEELLTLTKKIFAGMRTAGYEVVPDSYVDKWSREDLEYLVVNYGDSYLD